MTPTRRVNASNPAPQKKAKLGQNFLIDPSAAQRIVDALGDISKCMVIEIGPGRGAITDLLAQRAEKVTAIEFDRLLATQLRMHYARKPNVEVIEANVLAVDFITLVQGARQGVTDRQPGSGAKARLLGNLPYYITSEILLKIFEYHRNFDVIVIMVQREVADRLAADPGTRDYGLLTVTAQLFTDVESLFTLPPGAFSPAPKVHSTVLRMTVNPKAERLGVRPAEFIEFLKLCFAQKRKTLTNNLRARFEAAQLKSAIASASLRADVRAEAVSLEGLAQLYLRLSPK
jgi:16S rRNA (adenine1518-N6/adenine1519-N6)-dimethyltransferase